MKRALIILTLTAGTCVWAQTGSAGAGAAAGSGAAASPGSGAFLPAQSTPRTTPGQTGPGQTRPTAPVTGQTQVPGVAAGVQATNQLLPGQTLTNQALNSQLVNAQRLNVANTPQLAARLAALQNEIQATLLLLSAFNVAVGQQGAMLTSQPTPQAYIGNSYRTNMPDFDSRPGFSQVQPPRGVLPRTGRLDVGFRYPTSVATNSGSGVSLGEFRALVVLQNDMERMLPILSALNQGGLSGTGAKFGTSSPVFGGLTNQFGTPGGQAGPGLNQQRQLSPRQNQLTPTGR